MPPLVTVFRLTLHIPIAPTVVSEVSYSKLSTGNEFASLLMICISSAFFTADTAAAMLPVSTFPSEVMLRIGIWLHVCLKWSRNYVIFFVRIYPSSAG